MADSTLTTGERQFLSELNRRGVSGLRDFASEYEAVRFETIDEIPIPVLPLRRILESKRAAARPKDQALIHALEDALALLDEGEGG